MSTFERLIKPTPCHTPCHASRVREVQAELFVNFVVRLFMDEEEAELQKFSREMEALELADERCSLMETAVAQFTAGLQERCTWLSGRGQGSEVRGRGGGSVPCKVIFATSSSNFITSIQDTQHLPYITKRLHCVSQEIAIVHFKRAYAKTFFTQNFYT